MIPLNNNEDIFDIAIAMQYFKNSRYSSDTIHTYANHFLYKSVYQKLMSFSKKELETVFWDDKNKSFHENPKSKNHEIKFSHNIYDVILSLRNSLFFSAIIEKGAFKEKYNPVVKFLLKDKKSSNSLEFFDLLYYVQTAQRMNDPEGGMKQLSDFNGTIFNFIKDLNTEEKNEIYLNFLNKTIKNDPKHFVEFILSHLNYFNEEHLLIINSKIKENNIDINKYQLFEKLFPQDNKNDSFFISSSSHEKLDKAFDFGFRANSYQYQGLNLQCTLYTYGLRGNAVGDKWESAFIRKILINSTLSTVDEFTVHMGTDLVKLKKHGHNFENIGKEALNNKLHNTLSELPKSKQPKI